MLDRERPVAFIAMLVLVTVMLTLFLGVGLLVTAIPRLGTLGRVFVGACFLLPACGSLFLVAETITRWWWSRRRPGAAVLGVAPSGAAATVVPRSGAALIGPTVMAASMFAFTVLLAVRARPVPWLAALIALGALALVTRLLPILLGHARAGGLYLTPSGVEHRYGVCTTEVPWDSLVVPDPGPPFPLAGRATEIGAVGMPSHQDDLLGAEPLGREHRREADGPVADHGHARPGPTRPMCAAW